MYKSPTAKPAPPPVLSKLNNADSLLECNGALRVSNNFVVSFHFLTLHLAPKLGSVVFNQTEPVGLGFASVDLNSGTEVCGAICNAGTL